MLAVPPVALRLALGRQLADELLLGSLRVLPARLLGSGYRFRTRRSTAHWPSAGRNLTAHPPEGARRPEPASVGDGASPSTVVARSSPPGSRARTGTVTPLST